MPEIIAAGSAAVLVISGMLLLRLQARAARRREALRRERERPLTPYETHRKKWLDTGDPAELALMNETLEKRED